MEGRAVTEPPGGSISVSIGIGNINTPTLSGMVYMMKEGDRIDDVRRYLGHWSRNAGGTRRFRYELGWKEK